MTSRNPLKQTHAEASFRNPLTDPKVAREWAAWAKADGKTELARQWADHAWKLENGRSMDGPPPHMVAA
jgi:hypothetical protein